MKRLFPCIGWSQQGSEARNTSLNLLSPCCKVSGFSSLYDTNLEPSRTASHPHPSASAQQRAQPSQLLSQPPLPGFVLGGAAGQRCLGRPRSVTLTACCAPESAFPQRQQTRSRAELLCSLTWMRAGILLKGRRQMTRAKNKFDSV